MGVELYHRFLLSFWHFTKRKTINTVTLWIKHTAALLALTSSFGGYRYYRYQFEQKFHQHEDKTWHDNIECVHEVAISLLASTGQKAWIEPAVNAFNASHRSRIHVSVSYAEDRDALQSLLSGKLKPVLWSPGATIWADRLNETSGGKLVRHNDPNAARTYLQTSLVLLAPKNVAETAGEDGRDLSRFSHANPAATSSGFFTLGVLLDEYRETLPGEQQALSATAVAKSDGFLEFLRERESKLFYDDAGQSGTVALTRSFAQKPNRYGAVWTWKNAASEVLSSRDDLAIIEPQTPVVACQSVVLLNTPAVTADQRKATRAFLDYLATPDAIALGTKAGFEPAKGGVTESADYDALNAATYQWRRLRIAPEL